MRADETSATYETLATYKTYETYETSHANSITVISGNIPTLPG